jgi:uncharacterized protein
MRLVDTNVLIYAANQDATDHQACRDLLEQLRTSPQPTYLTWGIVYEFLRVVTHPSVLERPWDLRQAWSFVTALLAAPAFEVLSGTDRHHQVLGELIDEMPSLRGNLLHDVHIAALMREHGITRIITRDGDFHRFDYLEVVDPLAT